MSSAASFGPIPRLAEALAASCFQEGGPWAAYTRQLLAQPSAHLAPARRHFLPPRASLGFWGRLWRFFRSLFGADPAGPAPAPAPAPPPEPADLNVLLKETHTWLAASNIKAIAPCLRSQPGGHLQSLGSVSDVGIFWALTTWRFLAKPRFDDKMMTASSAWQPERFADRLSMHVSIERLILALAPAAKPQTVRTTGGLRRAEVLRAAEELAAAPDAPWPELCRIMKASPLTVLIYADLLGSAHDAGDKTSPSGVANAETARRALQFDPDDGDEQWRVNWLTLLARSTVGMILSPPSVTESIALAKEAVARHDAEEPPMTRHLPWWLRWFRDPRAEHMAWAAARAALLAEVKRFQPIRRRQCVDRLRFLSELLAVGAEDLGVPKDGAFGEPNQPRLAASYFVARAWDMCVRTLMARQTARILAAWPGLHAQRRRANAELAKARTAFNAATTEPERAQAQRQMQRQIDLLSPDGARDALVFGFDGEAEPSPLARDVLSQFTLLSFPEIASISLAEWSREARERLFDLTLMAHPEAIDESEALDPGTTLAALAGAAAVGLPAMRHACELLAGQNEEARVRLPVPPPDQIDRAPADYIVRWGRFLIPQTRPAAETSVLSGEESYYETV